LLNSLRVRLWSVVETIAFIIILKKYFNFLNFI